MMKVCRLFDRLKPFLYAQGLLQGVLRTEGTMDPQVCLHGSPARGCEDVWRSVRQVCFVVYSSYGWYFWLYFYIEVYIFIIDYSFGISNYSESITLALFVLLIYGELNGVAFIIIIPITQMTQQECSIIFPIKGNELTNKFFLKKVEPPLTLPVPQMLWPWIMFSLPHSLWFFHLE